MLQKLTSGVDGPLVIVARGDCTSRRALALNADLFDRAPALRQSQKSTFAQLLDTLNGLSLTEDFLNSISEVADMPRTLASYYLGQANRDVLNCADADLLMLDSYADMNFSLWRNRAGGPRFWIHPKHLKDRESFLVKHEELGRATLADAVRNATEFISRMRELAPGLPVLFLNQQVDYYPKLEDRQSDFYRFGALVAEQSPNTFFGGVVAKDNLALADVGSCGPGNTLHFQGETYRTMIESAMAQGLGAAVADRAAQKAELQAQTRSAAHQLESPMNAATPSPTQPSAELRSAACKYADLVITEIIEPSFQFTPDAGCNDDCLKIVQSAATGFENYFYQAHRRAEQVEPPRFTPMMIDLETVGDFTEWIYSRPATYRHQFQKSERAGYKFERMHAKNHTADFYEINTSKDVRSGGQIRANLTKSIEELGGLPTRWIDPVLPKCDRHWRQLFGVFVEDAEYRQGDLVVGKKLLAYLSVVRFGEFATFAQIMGHADHLAEGVVNFVAQKFVELAKTQNWGADSGLRYLMYGGAQNGGEGLYNFKRRSGMTPYIVSVPFQPGYSG
ncbi:MAG: hypothetical protein RIR46_544 [Actinomycetota bacterium]|jgi:hypothetical protein